MTFKIFDLSIKLRKKLSIKSTVLLLRVSDIFNEGVYVLFPFFRMEVAILMARSSFFPLLLP